MALSYILKYNIIFALITTVLLLGFVVIVFFVKNRASFIGLIVAVFTVIFGILMIAYKYFLGGTNYARVAVGFVGILGVPLAITSAFALVTPVVQVYENTIGYNFIWTFSKTIDGDTFMTDYLDENIKLKGCTELLSKFFVMTSLNGSILMNDEEMETNVAKIMNNIGLADFGQSAKKLGGKRLGGRGPPIPSAPPLTTDALTTAPLSTDALSTDALLTVAPIPSAPPFPTDVPTNTVLDATVPAAAVVLDESSRGGATDLVKNIARMVNTKYYIGLYCWLCISFILSVWLCMKFMVDYIPPEGGVTSTSTKKSPKDGDTKRDKGKGDKDKGDKDKGDKKK